jgi:HEAT repeat protein
MDSTLKKLLALLSSDDADVQSAAARVLGELRLEASEVIRALGHAASGPHLAARSAAIDALGRIGSLDALPHILPLLTSPQLGERNKALAATVALGPKALPKAIKTLSGDDPITSATRLAVLQRFPVEHSIPYILDSIPQAEPPTLELICDDFHKKAEGLDEPTRQAVTREILKRGIGPEIQKSEPALTGVLRMLGALRCDLAMPFYMKVAESKKASPRCHRLAFLGLSRIHLPPKEEATLYRLALSILEKEEYPALVQASAELLGRIHLPDSAAQDLIPLLNHRDESVRILAVRGLGEHPGPETAAALAACVETPDWRLRREIMSSLRKCPHAGEALLDRLEKIDDRDVSQQVSQAVLELKPPLTSAQSKRFFESALRLQETHDPRAASICALLASLNREDFEKRVTEQGEKRLKKKEYQKAAAALSLLTGPPSTQHKYLLALARLKQSNRGLLESERASDRSLSLFSELVEFDGVDLAAWVIRDEDILDRQEIYYLGFHFVEQLGGLRQFGAKLLSRIIKSAPRSKEAKDARNKLRISGIAEES